MDRLLDNGRDGPTYLRIPGVAQLIENAIERGSGSDYLLHAWVVMPNHVHLLITPQTDLPRIMQKLKGSSALKANQLLGRTGMTFWQEESYDRLVRDAVEFRKIENYIVQNPVRAGLAVSAEQYRWSSASATRGLKPAAD